MAQLICVIGMHRSGTSALTGALVRAGAWFGNPALAIERRADSPLGLVERKDFVRLNNRVLRTLGCSWHDVYAFPREWQQDRAARFQKKFRNGVMADLRSHELSVLKDPRLCFLLPLFRPVMPADMVCAMIVRHPLEVAKSLQVRNGFSIEFGVALWEAYNRQALASARAFPSVLVQHRSLLQDSEKCLRQTLITLSNLGVRDLDIQSTRLDEAIDAKFFHNRLEGMEEHILAPEQHRFWLTLKEATTPLAVEPGQLSSDSQARLQNHHARCVERSSMPRDRGSPGVQIDNVSQTC